MSGNTYFFFHEGIRAYQNFEYQSAIVNLQVLLNTPSISKEQRIRALIYIGAACFLINRTDDTTNYFSEALDLNPNYQIEKDIFKPEITDLFQIIKNQK